MKLSKATLVLNPHREELEKTIAKTRVIQRQHQSKSAKDTAVKMIACRSDTAMVVMLRRHLNKQEEA